eukprot:1379539-Prymnesium_polylepis.1
MATTRRLASAASVAAGSSDGVAVGWRNATSWFPGHMAQASKDMSQRLGKVDLVIEVRDAR